MLCNLFNDSVPNGSLPSCLKFAQVILIRKSGSKTDVKNSRPISTLPFIDKVFERSIHSRPYDYYVKYNVFYSDQYGFLKKKSTTDAILKFTDLCYSTFKNKQLLMSIFLDFSKAFDTVDHVILCRKNKLFWNKKLHT